MNRTDYFEVELYPNKQRLKLVYGIGLGLFLLAVGGIIWSKIYWEAYSYYVQDVLTGKISITGAAPIINSWSWMFAVAIPIVYGLMFFATDFKNPSIAINRKGLFINEQLLKMVQLEWNQFDLIEITKDYVIIKFKNPEDIVSHQPSWRKLFLKQTFIKDQSQFCFEKSDLIGDFERLTQLLDRYYKEDAAVRAGAPL